MGRRKLSEKKDDSIHLIVVRNLGGQTFDIYNKKGKKVLSNIDFERMNQITNATKDLDNDKQFNKTIPIDQINFFQKNEESDLDDFFNDLDGCL